MACGRVVSTGGTPTTLARFGGATCYSTPRSGADTLVVSGQRVAWLVYGGGDTLETTLVAARRPSTTASQIAFATLPDDGGGKDLAGVVAEGGGLLWAVRTINDAGHDHAHDPAPPAAERAAGQRRHADGLGARARRRRRSGS